MEYGLSSSFSAHYSFTNHAAQTVHQAHGGYDMVAPRRQAHPVLLRAPGSLSVADTKGPTCQPNDQLASVFLVAMTLQRIRANRPGSWGQSLPRAPGYKSWAFGTPASNPRQNTGWLPPPSSSYCGEGDNHRIHPPLPTSWVLGARGGGARFVSGGLRQSPWWSSVADWVKPTSALPGICHRAQSSPRACPPSWARFVCTAGSR
jgi:hypothetical protein